VGAGGVEPPSSANYREPLCGSPFSQVALNRNAEVKCSHSVQLNALLTRSSFTIPHRSSPPPAAHLPSSPPPTSTNVLQPPASASYPHPHQHFCTNPTLHSSPFRSPIALQSYHPNPTHDSSAPRRRPDGGVSPSTVWSRRWPARGRVVSCGAIPAAHRPTRRLPGGASGGVPVGGRRRGQVGPDVRRTVRGRSLSTIGVHPVRFSSVRCPAVRCPTVRCPTVGRPVTWLRRPGPTCPTVWCRPSGVRPSDVGPSVLWRPSRTGSARHRLGTTPLRQGLHGWSGWSSVSPAGCPSGSIDGCGGLDAGDAAEVVGRPVGEGAGREPGPGRARAEAAAALGADRPGRSAWPGVARRQRLTWAGMRDHSPWSLSSLTLEWTGLEGQ
jgi:hypothetical protein